MASERATRYRITVAGANQTIAWVHARTDLEEDGGGTILSPAPVEQRSVEPVTAAFLIVVYFGAKAVSAAAAEFGKEIGGAAGREVVERYAAKLREQGAEVTVEIEEAD